MEVFPDANQAKAPSDYIQDALKGSPILGTEWHYTPGGGRVLVRVGGDVEPFLAKRIDVRRRK